MNRSPRMIFFHLGITSVACVLFAFPVLLVAQPPVPFGLTPSKHLTQYIHEAWQTEKTPLEGAIRSMAQTREGYLWIGAQEGLFRFDGDNITPFNTRTTPQFASNVVSALFEDREGNLWIGTSDGLLKYRDRSFTRYTTDDGLSSNIIVSLFEDRRGILWIGTANAGVNVLSGGIFSPWGINTPLEKGTVWTICEDDRGSLYFGTAGGGVFRFDETGLKNFTRRQGLAHGLVRSLAKGSNGSIWVGTQGGLSKLQGSTIISYTARNGLSNEIVTSVLEDRYGTVWCGTSGGGVNRLRDGSFSSFTSKNGLTNDDVLSFCEDREGNLWLGTSDGLNRLRDGDFTTYTILEGMTNDVVWCVLEDRKGTIWLGTNGGGLNRLTISGNGLGTVARLPVKLGLSNKTIRTMMEDRDGTLWVGTYGEGLYRVRDGSAAAEFVDSLNGKFIYCILEDRQRNLWIGTGNGLYRKDRQGTLTQYSAREGLPDGFIRFLHEDRTGSIWIGTNGGGLSRWTRGTFTNYSAASGLAPRTMMCIHEDGEGTLWIGTYNDGLVRFKDGIFTSMTSREGLHENIIYEILEDDEGNLWMGGNRGISRVKKQDLDDYAGGRRQSIPVTVYGKDDGLRARECNGGSQPAGWKSRDGRLWFATMKGASVIDPKLVRFNTIPPEVVIQELSADGQDLAVSEELTLGAGTNRILVRYAALGFRSPQKIQYRYILEGYDADWIEARNRRTVIYTNIPPGRYTLRIIAANEEGVWNTVGASMMFTLEPFFYQTRVFFALCAVMIIITVGGTYWYREKRFRRRTDELETRVGERTEEVVEQKNKLAAINKELKILLSELGEKSRLLEIARAKAEEANHAKSIFLTNISHELRTPLNSVIGFTNILLKNKTGNLHEQELTYLERILENGKHLLTLINEVLDLSKIEAGQIEVRRMPVSLTVLISETIAQLEGRLAGKKLEIRVEMPDPVAPLETDPSKLKQILINLIGNAIKFTDRGGVIVRVAVTPVTRTPVRIDVQDTGIGIPRDVQELIFEPFKQGDTSTTRKYGGTGLGLTISRTLSGLLGYALEVNSEIGKGSTFSIVLDPVAKELVTMESQRAAAGDESMDASGLAPRSLEHETKERILAELQPLYHGAWAHMNLNRIALFGRNITEATSARQYERFRVALMEYSMRVHPILRNIAQEFQRIQFDPKIVQALRFHADELMKTVQHLSVNPGISDRDLARMEVEIPKHVDQLLHALRVMRDQIFRSFQCKPQEVLLRSIEQWSQREEKTTFSIPSPLIEEGYGVVITVREFEDVLNRFVENTVGRVPEGQPRELIFRGERTEDRWNFEICDTSTLLPLRMWKQVFTPPGNDPVPKGLAAVPAILQKYDADVCVKESSEETGTTFLIRFKVVKGQ